MRSVMRYSRHPLSVDGKHLKSRPK
jgi:hypothetical protein